MYLLEEAGSRGVLFSTDTIPGCVTNIYLIKGKSRNFIIDTGLGEAAARYVLEYINKTSPKPNIVINTHYHWDHIWGNSLFTGCDIYAHLHARELIEENWENMKIRFGKWQEGVVEKVLPGKLITDAIHFPEEGIEVFYSPGHTSDSISVYDRVDGILHVGDNVETLMPEIYGSRAQLVESLRKYLTYDFCHCVSGHNKQITREDIIQVLNFVQAEVDKG